ncbi:MAG: carboxylating nicotinate-nucleotide diphosphorylase [Bryobacterales bacterium]
MSSWDHPEIRDLIARALAEDIGPGDVTTEACVPEDARAEGFFLTREPLVVAGLPLLEMLYDKEDLNILFEDGQKLEAEVVFAQVSGSARRLLTLERTALNLLQRTSGIATISRRFADAVAGTGCKVLDTRKTAPGMRRLEKLAVAAGGCVNHRFGLFDAILIKNNHITAAGGVREAYERCKAKGLPVEIEVRSFEELDEALAVGADHLLLDNLAPAEAREAVERVRGRAKVEISGGVNLQTVRAYAETGADFVSVGALTHSAPAADISFRLK